MGDVVGLWKSAGKRGRKQKPQDFYGRTDRYGRCEGCGRASLVIDLLCRECAPPLHHEFERQGGHLQIHPVIKAFGQWAVTDFGIECTQYSYFFQGARVWDSDWKLHMADKSWVNLRDFVMALDFARETWPLSDDARLARTLADEKPMTLPARLYPSADNAVVLRAVKRLFRACSICQRKHGYRPYFGANYVSLACAECRVEADGQIAIRLDGVMDLASHSRRAGIVAQVVSFVCDGCGTDYRHAPMWSRNVIVLSGDGVLVDGELAGGKEGLRGVRCEVCANQNIVPMLSRPVENTARELVRFHGEASYLSRYASVSMVMGVSVCRSCPYCFGQHELRDGEAVDAPCAPDGYTWRLFATADGRANGVKVRSFDPRMVFSRSGKWECDMREPIVKVFKDEKGNGAFAMATMAKDASEFLQEAAKSIANLPELVGDGEFTLEGLLPQVCAIWAKLQGYKADAVFERRVLIAGQPNPEAHMRLLNQSPIEIAVEPELATATH
jgi:hypothetical protein